MKPSLLQQLLLYRYRLIVGFVILGVFLVTVIVWQLSTLGPGISPAEQSSALASITWNWDWGKWQDAALYIVNLPYLLLQKVSIATFGLSTFSIRLPSAIIAVLTSLFFFLLMRHMYKMHIALITSILFASSSWYIAMTHFGAPYIMVPFVWLLVLYAFMRLVRLERSMFAWAALAAFSSIFALYTPYGIYALLIVILIACIHPQVHRALAAIEGPQVVLGIFIIIPFIAPLIWGIYQDPQQLWQLLGLSSALPSPADFARNLGEIIAAIVWRAPEFPELRLTTFPLIDIGTAALLAAGLWRITRDWRAIRSQFVIVSFVVLFIVLALNPVENNYIPLIVPTYLLIGTGITVLFKQWYRLFPRNPYARSFGLLPIIIFLAMIAGFHYQKYFVAWANAPQTYAAYNSDLSLVREQLTVRPDLILVVPAEQQQWYSVLLRSYPQATLATNTTQTTINQSLLISSEIPRVRFYDQRPLTPIVNSDKDSSLRFWLAATE